MAAFLQITDVVKMGKSLSMPWFVPLEPAGNAVARCIDDGPDETSVWTRKIVPVPQKERILTPGILLFSHSALPL